MIDDLTPERRKALETRICELFAREFDEPISPFRAGRLVDLMLNVLGPEIYNQAVADVREHFQARLDDLEGDVYWPPEDEA